jgi:hypothetical protein
LFFGIETDQRKDYNSVYPLSNTRVDVEQKKNGADGVQQSQFNQLLHMPTSNMQTDPEHSPFATGPTDPTNPAGLGK